MADRIGERAALDVLHDDDHGLRIGGDVVDGHQVRVVQRCAEARFALEALGHLLRAAGVQPLHRNHAAEALVLGQEHAGHPARAEAADHAVPARERRLGRPCHRLMLARHAADETRFMCGRPGGSVRLGAPRASSRATRCAPLRSARRRAGRVGCPSRSASPARARRAARIPRALPRSVPRRHPGRAPRSATNRSSRVPIRNALNDDQVQ